MSFFDWLRVNRLKFFSFCAVAGDMLTGLGGASMMVTGEGAYGWLLMAGSALALGGHAVLLFWGRGAKDARIGHVDGAMAPIWARPFVPWHYPLDTGFLTFSISALCYTVWGAQAGNIPMLLVGLLLMSASLLGWLWPQERSIFGLSAVQVTASMYLMASVNTLLAGIVAHNPFIIASACIYGLGNAVLFTTRKEHQSSYTQSHS